MFGMSNIIRASNAATSQRKPPFAAFYDGETPALPGRPGKNSDLDNLKKMNSGDWLSS